MRFGSLFAGIGGFDLGLERAGMKCAWQIEIDDYANKVLEKHWPHVPRYRDVRECGKHNLPHVDLLCGGFPCQPHSLAGKRKASEDERDLWGEFARIIGEIKPRWVMAENVRGLLSSEFGRFFGRVLRDLASLGYDVEWHCIPASAVGAPHQRDRVWIIANTNREIIGEQQIGEQKSSDAPIIGNDGPPQSLAANSNATPVLGKEEFGSESNRNNECAEIVADTNGQPTKRLAISWEKCRHWEFEPDVGRVADGIPLRVDRLRCLGNAVVPQIPEIIGKAIMDFENANRS